MFGYVDKVIEEKTLEIKAFDRIDDSLGLDEADAIRRKKCPAELVKNLQWKESILYQKANASWILEGDANSKVFPKWINKRNQHNEITGLVVNNMWVDFVNGVRAGIFQHFKDHYSSNHSLLASLSADLFQKHIDDADNSLLEAECTKEEVRYAIWSC